MADTKKTETKAADAGEAEVQRNMDEGTDKGFFGVEVDPTPNENYTLQGVTSGKPTPETDAGAARTAREATGLGLSGLEAADRDRNAEQERR